MSQKHSPLTGNPVLSRYHTKVLGNRTGLALYHNQPGAGTRTVPTLLTPAVLQQNLIARETVYQAEHKLQPSILGEMALEKLKKRSEVSQANVTILVARRRSFKNFQ